VCVTKTAIASGFLKTVFELGRERCRAGRWASRLKFEYSITSATSKKRGLMRALELFIVLLVMSSTGAMANKLTLEDADRASALSGSVLTALKDILAAEKGMMQVQEKMQVHGVNANSYCVESIRNNFLFLETIVSHFQDLVSLDARMQDDLDEEPILILAKIRADEFIGQFGDIRSTLNGLAGTCSQFPLAVAKAQQGLDLLTRAISLFKSISGRLNK
jgi:hypothetical protein